MENWLNTFVQEPFWFLFGAFCLLFVLPHLWRLLKLHRYKKRQIQYLNFELVELTKHYFKSFWPALVLQSTFETRVVCRWKWNWRVWRCHRFVTIFFISYPEIEDFVAVSGPIHDVVKMFLDNHKYNCALELEFYQNCKLTECDCVKS